MPLLIKRKIDKNAACVAVWQIRESLEELQMLYGKAPEQDEKFRAYRHAIQRSQWLAARILYAELSGDPDTTIQYDPFGKPVLNNSHFISISHAGEYVAMIYGPKPNGIDIEVIGHRALGVSERFLSEKERKTLEGEEAAYRAMLYWSAKESLYKLHGKKELEFRTQLYVHPFASSNSGIMIGEIKKEPCSQHTLQYENIGPCVLVYVAE